MPSARDTFNWKVVWAAFLLALFSWGLNFYGPPVFLQTLHATRGWSVSTISSAITLHFMFSAAIGTYLPEMHRRFGVQRVTQAGIVIAAIGILGWSNAHAPWQLFIVALASGAGWSMTNSAAVNAVVAPWFDKDRPKALSFAFNGASCGGLLFTPLWVFLIGRFGFPQAAVVIAACMLVVLIPVTANVLSANPPSTSHPPGTAAPPVLTRRQMLRDRNLMTISAAFALALFAQVGLLSHLIARLAPEFGAGGAALMLSLITVCAVIGRSLFGWFMGEHNRRAVAAVSFAIQTAGTVLLIIGNGLGVLLAGCVLFGIGFGNLTSLPPLIVQKEFSGPNVGKAVALIVAINQGVFALAPATLGILRDLEGSYQAAFILAAGMFAVSACIILTGRKAG